MTERWVRWSRREFLIRSVEFAGLALASVLLPKKVEASPFIPEGKKFQIADYIESYVLTAMRNCRLRGDGRWGFIPSPAYDGEWLRDSFWTVLGLKGRIGDYQSVLGDVFRSFEDKITSLTGQAPTKIPIGNEGDDEFRNDESTLLYLLMAYFAKDNGISIDSEKLGQAAGFIKSQVDKKGFYVSSSESFCTWADTVKNPQRRESFAYTQGLYALATSALRKMEVGNIGAEEVLRAKNNYRSFYNPRVGCLSMGNEVYKNVQDASALLPEFLSRFLVNEPILPDEHVLKTVNHLLETASVKFGDGKLAGIKVVSNLSGEFLSSEQFEEPESLNAQGYYQNGGYWPMFTLVALSLAYKITPKEQYAQAVNELLRSEMSGGLCGKEYLVMDQKMLGQALPNRFNYSWNVLAYQAIDWSGILWYKEPKSQIWPGLGQARGSN